MSRMFVSTVANVGKLVANTGTRSLMVGGRSSNTSLNRNYASNAVDRFLVYMKTKEDLAMKKMKYVDQFTVSSVNGYQDVKLVRNLPGEKIKVKVNVEDFVYGREHDKNVDFSIIKPESAEDVTFASENSDLQKLRKDLQSRDVKTFVVELDKGKNENLVVLCELESFDKKINILKAEVMAKEGQQTKTTSDYMSDEICDHISEILQEKGITDDLISHLEKWFENVSFEDPCKLKDVRTFLES